MGARGHHKKQGIQGLPPPSFRPDGAVRSAIAPLRSAFARFLLPLRLRARGCPAAQAAARFQVGRRRCAVRPMALSSAWLPALLVVLWAWVLRRRPHTAHSTRVRRSAIVLVVLLSGRYLLWRATSTLNLVSGRGHRPEPAVAGRRGDPSGPRSAAAGAGLVPAAADRRGGAPGRPAVGAPDPL